MKRRILIADDSRQTCEQLRQLLEADGGFAVDVAHDGTTALRMLTESGYGVFLIQSLMDEVTYTPGASGTELRLTKRRS